MLGAFGLPQESRPEQIVEQISLVLYYTFSRIIHSVKKNRLIAVMRMKYVCPKKVKSDGGLSVHYGVKSINFTPLCAESIRGKSDSKQEARLSNEIAVLPTIKMSAELEKCNSTITGTANICFAGASTSRRGTRLFLRAVRSRTLDTVD